MQTSDFRLGKGLGLGLVCSAAVLVTACGGGSSTSYNSATPTPAPTSTPTPTATPAPTATPEPTPAPTEGPTTTGKVSGPLDPVQDQVVTGVIADTVGAQLPAPLDSLTACIADTINSLVDVPDAALVLAAGGNIADPDVTAQQIEFAIGAFASQLENLAFALVGDGSCDEDHTLNPFEASPFDGTALATLPADLAALATLLDDYAAAEDPDLSVITGAPIQAALTAISAELALIPLTASDAPVVGDALSTLSETLVAVTGMLGDIGTTNAAGTQTKVETLVTNLLSSVLTGVVPTADLDSATNGYLASIGELESSSADTDTAALLTTLSGLYGDNLATVIPANFSTALTSAIAPGTAAFEQFAAGAANLDGALGFVSGDGLALAPDTLASMLLVNQSSIVFPTDALVAALTGSTTPVAPLDLLTSLGAADALTVDGLLSGVVDRRELLALSVDDSVTQTIDTILGGTLTDLLVDLLSLI